MTRRIVFGDLAFVFLNGMVLYSLWPVHRANLWELAAGLGTVWYSWAFSFIIFTALRAKWDRIVLGKDGSAETAFEIATPWGERR